MLTLELSSFLPYIWLVIHLRRKLHLEHNVYRIKYLEKK